MAEIHVARTDRGLEARTPYHPEFVARARDLGGRWDPAAKAWVFDLRDEERVRELCRRVWGTDGTDEPELVTLRVTLRDCQLPEVWLAGRCVAKRAFRDAPVRLGEGVILVEGSFRARGGSQKYPALQQAGDPPVTLEVRDIPRPLAAKVSQRDGVESVELCPSE